MYLLDTNVVSELRKPKPHGSVLEWFSTVDDAELHLSALTLGEIQVGIEITRTQNPTKAAELDAWLELVARSHNILPMDAEAFRTWARLMHRKSNTLDEDAMIAATAQVHQLTLVTRNTSNFKALGVQSFNPFTIRSTQRTK